MRPGQAYGALFRSDPEPAGAEGYGPYADGYRFPPTTAPTPPPSLDDALKAADPKTYYQLHPWETPRAVDGQLRRMGLKPQVQAADTAADPLAPAVRRGGLSMSYETGHQPGQEAEAAATVSTNRGDPGGVSYGAYQLASGQGQVQAFLKQDGARWADRFAGADPREYGGEFGKIWKGVAQEDPEAFFNAQHAFIERTHYSRVVDQVHQRTGVDINSLSPAVQDVVWSMAVQHGRAASVIAGALGSLHGRLGPGDPGYQHALIDALYDHRESYVRRHNQPDLVQRYERERRDAQRMAGP